MRTATGLLIRICVVLCLFTCFSEADQEAGVKATVTEKLLREITDEEVDKMSSDLVGKTFPSLSGKSGSLEYKVRNIRITSLYGMTSHLDLRSPRTVYWTGGMSSIRIKADFKAKYRVLIVKIPISGSVTARGKGISMSISISLATQNGRLVLGLNHCTANINDLDLDFSRSLLSWILNIFSGIFESTIKDEVEDAICDAVKKEFGTLKQDVYDMENIFNITLIGIPLTLDAGYVDIKVTNHDLTVLSKGDILWHGQKFDPHDSNIMFLTPSGMGVSIGLKVDTVNNLLAALTEAQVLDGELSYEELKSRNLTFLKLHCPGDLCIGNAFKHVATEFPGRYLGMHWSIKEGWLEVGANEILGRLVGRVFFNAEDKYKSTHLFSGLLNLTAHFQVRFSGERITLKAVGLGGLIKIDESLIGKVLSKNVVTLTKLFVLPFLREQLLQIINDYKTDYHIPLPRHMSFKRALISLHEGLVQIDADICYRTFCAFAGNATWVGKTTTQDFDVQDVLPEPSTTTTTTTITTTARPITSHKEDSQKHKRISSSSSQSSDIIQVSLYAVIMLPVVALSLN